MHAKLLVETRPTTSPGFRFLAAPPSNQSSNPQKQAARNGSLSLISHGRLRSLLSSSSHTNMCRLPSLFTTLQHSPPTLSNTLLQHSRPTLSSNTSHYIPLLFCYLSITLSRTALHRSHIRGSVILCDTYFPRPSRCLIATPDSLPPLLSILSTSTRLWPP
jgi:hypothetical protein